MQMLFSYFYQIPCRCKYSSSMSFIIPSFFQKKRLSITHSFGSEHSDSSDGLLGGHLDSPPRTPGPNLAASDKDRSSTPMSSGSEERQFVVKVRKETDLSVVKIMYTFAV